MSISLYEEGEEEGVCVGDPIADCCAVVCTSNYTIMVIVNLSGCLSVGPSVYLYLSICQFIYICQFVSCFVTKIEIYPSYQCDQIVNTIDALGTRLSLFTN